MMSNLNVGSIAVVHDYQTRPPSQLEVTAGCSDPPAFISSTIEFALRQRKESLTRAEELAALVATHWWPLYEPALLATDESKLIERTIAARNAILDRMEETLPNSVASEHRVINHGSATYAGS